MSQLSGKVAVVTGASKGIGAGIAKELAVQGASVVVNYSSSKAGADKVFAEITKAGGKAVAVGGSVEARGHRSYFRRDKEGVWELAPKTIRVNAVNSGAVHTEGFESAGFKGSPFEAHMVQNTPLGRLGTLKISRTS
jgi:NAD(P)-dependent dehydrogenase (short-subunit alcohol dehydrogenase family)